MAISDILFRISTDTTAFQTSMGKVNGTLDKLDKQARKTTSGFTALGASLSSAGLTMTAGFTAPMIALGIGAVKASGDIDVLKRALVATTGSADEAGKQFERLQTIAKLPGIGLEEAVRGSIRLQNYGLSAALSEKALRNFSNAVAAGGGSAEDTSEALRQLGQMYGRGKITMDNLRVILERVPQAAAIIRKEWGSEALADPAKAFEKLGLTSQQVIQTLVDRMDDVPRVSVGFTTSMENLGQAVKLAAASIGDELTPYIVAVIPKIEDMAGGVKDAIAGFKELPGFVQNTAIALGGLAIAVGPVELVMGKLLGAFTALKTFAMGAAAALQPIAAGISLIGTAAVAAGAAVGGFLYWLKQTPTALQQQKKAADEAAEGMRRINERMGTGAKAAGDLPLSFGLASEAIIQFGKAIPKATEETKKLGKETAKTGNVIKVRSVADLIYVESLERVKSAVGKVKDVMYEWSVQGTDLGKTMETQRMGLKRLASASGTYADGLKLIIAEQQKLVTADQVKNLPVALGMPQLPTTWSGSDSARDMGIETESARAKRIAALQRNADIMREANRRGDPNVSGNMVIEAEEKLRKAMEETGQAATRSGRAQSTAMRQVSTIATDLSRNIASAGIGLLFNRRAQADVSSYKKEIEDLEAEQQKLLFSQSKGNDVTKLLSINTAKLADAKKRMGEELRKATLGFAALEAGKSIVSSLAQSITRLLIEGALEKLSKKLLDVGGIFGKVFGGGTGVIKSATDGGGAGSIAGGGGGASSIAGAAGGVMGAVSAIAAVGTLISGIVGNFQNMAMNKSLDLIEHEVRYSQIHLLNTLNKANEFWPYMKACWESLVRMEERGMGIAGGAGGTINVSMAGAYLMSDSQMGDFADRLARFLKARGL